MARHGMPDYGLRTPPLLAPAPHFSRQDEREEPLDGAPADTFSSKQQQTSAIGRRRLSISISVVPRLSALFPCAEA